MVPSMTSAILAMAFGLSHSVRKVKRITSRPDLHEPERLELDQQQLNSSEGIVNGQDASQCAWPWQILLETPVTSCGGTIIGGRWVLTAAHCIEDETGWWTARQLWVTAGLHNRRHRGSSQGRSVSRVILHPIWDAGDLHYYGSHHHKSSTDKIAWDYDVALLELNQAFNFGSCVGKAHLPSTGDLQTAGRAWVTGWGALYSDGPTPDVLQEAEVQRIPDSECQRAYDTAYGQSINNTPREIRPSRQEHRSIQKGWHRNQN